MDTQPKPIWTTLPSPAQRAWIEQMHAFYPPGSMTDEEAIQLARYEYEQSESGSIYPPLESPDQALSG